MTIVVNLSPIVLAVALSILARKFGKGHAFPTASKTVRSLSGTQPICCSPVSVKQNTPIPYLVS